MGRTSGMALMHKSHAYARGDFAGEAGFKSIVQVLPQSDPFYGDLRAFGEIFPEKSVAWAGEIRYNRGREVARMADKILVADDEAEIADLVELYLSSENYEVYKFYTAGDALACIESTELDLAILDVMLPDVSGFDICRKIRERHNYPVIMLTARIEETDKITGLTLGADDYITKPFRPLELVARVKAQLRRYKRYNPAHTDQDALEHGGLLMNVERHECLLNEKPLELTPTEFSILRILLENQGRAVGAEELFHQIWRDEYYTKSNNTITVHIRHLREKLGEDAGYIKTVWGVGYKIEK